METKENTSLTLILLEWTGRLLLLALLIASILVFAHTLNGHEEPIRACFYADKYQGRLTANGAVYDQAKLTAAHLTLPLGTVLQVRNVHTGQTVVVEVNDRGPYSDRYSLDLSVAAARALGITKQAGWGWVSYKVKKLGDNHYERHYDGK